jgi:phosphoribosylaminoimidazole (AIR) synthetase
MNDKEKKFCDLLRVGHPAIWKLIGGDTAEMNMVLMRQLLDLSASIAVHTVKLMMVMGGIPDLEPAPASTDIN